MPPHTADLYVPDGTPPDDALARTTHLGIGAHQDDLEFMAFHGILACFQKDTQWFGGITCTDGAGSSRTGVYADFTDEQMCEVRRKEQRTAAQVGGYSFIAQLNFPSAEVKDPHHPALRDSLLALLRSTRPKVVYTHNLADKHDTHIGVAVATIQAIRALPPESRPEAVFGCEVWRNLDWLCDAEKVVHDVGARDHLAAALNGVFDSQVAGGKRYDLGVMGRRRANATFFESHTIDHTDALAFAMDLTPLAKDETLDIAAFVDGFVERFRQDVQTRLRSHLEA